MLSETQPSAAIFIGGMAGIRTEFDLFRGEFPDRPVYVLGRPGGEASSIASTVDTPLANELRSGGVYPALLRRIVDELSN